MRAIEIAENLYWVGAIDWGIRNFHGYKTSRGSSYNAYLICGSKNILIDSVKKEFFPEMRERILSVLPEGKIDFFISNHSEMDHSGALPLAFSVFRPDKIFASEKGEIALRKHFNTELPITSVKDGQELILGNQKFLFLETKMLHWPDSMFTYMPNRGILFSQDAFGMHFASAQIFSDLENQVYIEEETKKYFANIITPYSKLVINLLKKIKELDWQLNLVCSDHGPIHRDKKVINRILSLWLEWSNQIKKDKGLIVFDSMWGSTSAIARRIEDGLSSVGIDVIEFPLQVSHYSDIVSALLDAKLLLIGSPTLNSQMMPSVASALHYIQGLRFQNLFGQAFGSYGWNKLAIKKIVDFLGSEMAVEMLNIGPFEVQYVPTNQELRRAVKYGREIGIKIKETGENEKR